MSDNTDVFQIMIHKCFVRSVHSSRQLGMALRDMSLCFISHRFDWPQTSRRAFYWISTQPWYPMSQPSSWEKMQSLLHYFPLTYAQACLHLVSQINSKQVAVHHWPKRQESDLWLLHHCCILCVKRNRNPAEHHLYPSPFLSIECAGCILFLHEYLIRWSQIILCII